MLYEWKIKAHGTTALLIRSVAILSFSFLSACGPATAVVPDAEGMEPISALKLRCDKPYKLTQDCSGFSGASRLIEISAFQFKIAGIEDGSIVLIMGAKKMSNALTGNSAETANVAYELSKRFLLENGVTINFTEPVSSGRLLAGYVITTDENAYEILSQMSVENIVSTVH